MMQPTPTNQGKTQTEAVEQFHTEQFYGNLIDDVAGDAADNFAISHQAISHMRRRRRRRW